MSSLSDGFSIKSLFEQVTKPENGLYNLFKSTIRNNVDTIKLNEYIVPVEEEMRIDLIMKSIYELDYVSLEDYFGEVDVLLVINNIDNPLNIKRGQIIKYPSIVELESYRITEESDLSSVASQALNGIGVPSKRTRVDNSRKKYNKTGLALPPIANSNPKDSVVMKNGNFNIGGI
jgi:hypothetical protein